MSNLTESEAWAAIGDVLCATESMPPRYMGNGVLPGLCAAVRALYFDQMISASLMEEMNSLLSFIARPVKPNFLFPTFEWEPRAMLAYMLADFCEGQE